MPLYVFSHFKNIFSPEEKKNLSTALTSMYTKFGLPAFYVQVRFQEHGESQVYIGGEDHHKFVGIQIHHLARSFTSDRQKKAFLDQLDSILNPLFRGKGLQWEYFVTENERDLWKINGIVPPPAGSDMEKEWVRLNRPVEGISRESL